MVTYDITKYDNKLDNKKPAKFVKIKNNITKITRYKTVILFLCLFDLTIVPITSPNKIPKTINTESSLLSIGSSYSKFKLLSLTISE